MDSKKVIDIFTEITRIPRESGHEELIGAYLKSFAEVRGLDFKSDEFGNILITKPATPGKENVPTLVLQSHQDMVCEKNEGVDHDFSKDPIKFEIENGWMIAKDTTLGADDGIGIAAELALLDSDLPMGKLECVFTTSEETGLDGAFGMKPGFFTGKTLINLDSEEEGEFCIGCAGGINTQAVFTYVNEPIKDGQTLVKITVDGAQGGHSGDDINKERVNTVQQIARFLYQELKNGCQVVEINGGGKHNAIARESSAVIATSDVEGLIERVAAFSKDLQSEFNVTDPGVKAAAKVIECDCSSAIDAKTAGSLVRALYACPHGVIAMSQDIKGLVETSTNLASVKMQPDNKILIVTSQRSSISSACVATAEKVSAHFELAGAEAAHGSGYPGWKPDVKSKILADCVASYKKLFGVEPIVKAIHAGLECGLFGEKFGNMDMISFGPTLQGVHAPGEKMDLASMEKFVALLVDVVVNFA